MIEIDKEITKREIVNAKKLWDDKHVPNFSDIEITDTAFIITLAGYSKRIGWAYELLDEAAKYMEIKINYT